MKDDTCDRNPPRDKLQATRTKTGSQVADQKYKSKTSLSPHEPGSEKESFRFSEDGANRQLFARDPKNVKSRLAQEMEGSQNQVRDSTQR